jgi:hypothetical protein
VRSQTSLAATLLLTAALQGCASCDTPPEGALTACEMSAVVPGSVKTDILFVIDDSGSMGEEQANLQANLSTFINDLANSAVQNDFQIGVTTTEIDGWDGSAISGAVAGRLVDGPGTGAAAFTGPYRILSSALPDATLIAEFQNNVAVGTTGSGKEQPIRAARLALEQSGPGGANEGFLRPGAKLAIVILTDEDDCSDSADPRVTTNTGCHTPALKSSDMDSLDGFVAFVRGEVLGERREPIIAVIAGVDPDTLLPTCGYNNNPNDVCCGSPTNDACAADTWAVSNGTYCGGGGTTSASYADPPYTGGVCPAGSNCCSTCFTAYDRADRLTGLAATMPFGSALVASVCDASYSQTLRQIAGLIASQTVPLEGAPADWRMLAVTVNRADGSRVACRLSVDGAADAASADAVYSPPAFGNPASINFANACSLDVGDRIEIDVICAG